MADPVFDPSKPYTTEGQPTFDPSKPYTTGKGTVSDPFILDLQNPGWGGTLPKLAAGVTQGFVLDPAEKIGELTGTKLPFDPKRLEATRTAAGTTTPGEIGRVAGTIANPLWRLLPALKTTEYASPGVRALAKLVTNAFHGGVAGAAEPTGATTPGQAAKETVAPAKWGAEIGALLGLPGAVAAKLGYESLQQPVREILRDLPLEFRRLERLRNLSVPAFTRWWHEQSVAPIGGKVPPISNKAAMDNVGKQIGEALDKSTANMTFDLTNPTVRQALSKTRADSSVNLATSGAALRAYNSVLNRLWVSPLTTTGGRLTSQQLQQISSNLEAHIRLIDPSVSPDNALLKRELENFRMSVLDNANGTPAEKEAYARARQAWRIHATGRDSQPLGEPHGHITPDQVARELDRRDPLRYPYGGGRRGIPDPLQSGVQAAQQALGNMAAAARRGKQGLPLRQPEDFAYPAGVIGNIVTPPSQEQQNQ